MLKSSLCDKADACTPVKGTIIVPNTGTIKAIRDEQVLIDDEKLTLVVTFIFEKKKQAKQVTMAQKMLK